MKNLSRMFLPFLAELLITFLVACSEGGTVIDPNTLGEKNFTVCEKGPGMCGPVYIEDVEPDTSIHSLSCLDSADISTCISHEGMASYSITRVSIVDSLSGFEWEMESLVKGMRTSVISMALDSLEKAFTICNIKSSTQILNLDGDTLKLYLEEKPMDDMVENCIADSTAFAENCKTLNGIFKSERHDCASGDLLISCLIPKSSIDNPREFKEQFVKKSIQECLDETEQLTINTNA